MSKSLETSDQTCLKCGVRLIKQPLQKNGLPLSTAEVKAYYKGKALCKKFVDCEACDRPEAITKPSQACPVCHVSPNAFHKAYDASRFLQIWSCPVHGTQPLDKK
jgi:hypothetical protein